jgi:16S rRNA processing protein RimM
MSDTSPLIPSPDLLPGRFHDAQPATGELLVVGQVSGLFGTRGWVKIHSYTRPRQQISSYNPWYLRGPDGWTQYALSEARIQRGGVIAHLAGIDDRDVAALIVRRDVAIRRDQLRALGAGEYYWSDLIGLKVENLQHEHLGLVSGMLDNAAHDVLEVVGASRRLIPFIRGVYVIDIDLALGIVRVDWHVDD